MSDSCGCSGEAEVLLGRTVFDFVKQEVKNEFNRLAFRSFTILEGEIGRGPAVFRVEPMVRRPKATR